jgi:hypothetical protein
MNRKWSCKYCGLENLDEPHAGFVDCVNYYRRWVERLNSLLPQGCEVMRVSLARETDARIWIAGEITYEALERLVIFIRFMQEAWTEAPTVVLEPAEKENVTNETNDIS